MNCKFCWKQIFHFYKNYIARLNIFNSAKIFANILKVYFFVFARNLRKKANLNVAFNPSLGLSRPKTMAHVTSSHYCAFLSLFFGSPLTSRLPLT
jgi:hypothetical protein